MQYLQYTYTKNLLIVSLKSNFNTVLPFIWQPLSMALAALRCAVKGTQRPVSRVENRCGGF